MPDHLPMAMKPPAPDGDPPKAPACASRGVLRDMSERILYVCQRCDKEVGEGEQDRGRGPHYGSASLAEIGFCEEKPE